MAKIKINYNIDEKSMRERLRYVCNTVKRIDNSKVEINAESIDIGLLCEISQWADIKPSHLMRMAESITFGKKRVDDIKILRILLEAYEENYGGFFGEK